MEFTNIGMWEQTLQINNSYNKFITCNSSIFYHQIFHIKKYIFILWAIIIYIYIYIYIKYHHINKFLGFSRGQRLHPIDRVVLSPFWGWNPIFFPSLMGSSFGTWRCTSLLKSSIFRSSIVYSLAKELSNVHCPFSRTIPC